MRKRDKLIVFSGMGLQMAITIAIGAYLGVWADQKWNTSKPYFTALGSIVGIGVAFYGVFKDLSKLK